LIDLSSPQVSDGNVISLNHVANSIMQQFKIPVINTHDAIVKRCGVGGASAKGCEVVLFF